MFQKRNFLSINNVEDIINVTESRNGLIGYAIYQYFIHKHRPKQLKPGY